MTAAAVRLAALRALFAGPGRLVPGLAARAAAELFARPQRHPRRPWEVALERRGEPVGLPGGLHATSWGAGPTVLLVHGWSGRGTQLAAFVDPLVRAGHRVVAMDGPAHGDSPGTTTDPNAFAGAVAAAEKTLGPLRGVVAHSFGGASVALAVSRGLRAERAVLIAAPSSLEVGLKAFETLLGLPAPIARRMRRRLEQRAGTALPDFDVASVADRLAVPALVVHGPDDAEVPYAEAERIAAVWPGARLRPVPDGGHRRLLRDPEVVAEVVGFLAADARPAEQVHASAGRPFTGA